MLFKGSAPQRGSPQMHFHLADDDVFAGSPLSGDSSTENRL